MAVWKILGSVAVTLALTPTAWTQTYPLAENAQEGDCFRYHMDMKLSGEMRITKDDKPVSWKLSATATHAFPERILAAAKGVPQKTARIYETAQAVFQVESDRSERTLRPERNLVVVQRPKDQTFVYSPKGPLTREELELTGGHFDTLALGGLLPGREVKMGDTWKISPEAVQSLCHLEGVTAHDLTGKLEEVKDDLARVSATGTVSGIDAGAMVKMTIQATYHFDLKKRRLVDLEWKQKDERDQGPASPGEVVEVTYVLKRTAIEQPDCLSDVALISVPDNFEPPVMMTHLSYHDAKSRFDMLYERDWQITSQTDDHLVMRLMDRGENVAQATITPWDRAKPGEHLSAEAFRKAMKEMPGWEENEMLQEGEIPTNEAGRWIYRISAIGEMDGMKVLQNFYLVAGPNGDQVVLAFTMTQAQAEKLGSRDLTMVSGVELPK